MEYTFICCGENEIFVLPTSSVVVNDSLSWMLEH